MNKTTVIWHSFLFLVQMYCLALTAYLDKWYLVGWCAIWAYYSLYQIIKEAEHAFHFPEE